MPQAIELGSFPIRFLEAEPEGWSMVIYVFLAFYIISLQTFAPLHLFSQEECRRVYIFPFLNSTG